MFQLPPRAVFAPAFRWGPNLRRTAQNLEAPESLVLKIEIDLLPPRSNMKSEKGPLERENNFYKPSVLGFHVNFRGQFHFLFTADFRIPMFSWFAGLINEYLQDIPQRRLCKKRALVTACNVWATVSYSCLTSKSCTYLHQRHCPKHWPRTKHNIINILWFPFVPCHQPYRGYL